MTVTISEETLKKLKLIQKMVLGKTNLGQIVDLLATERLGQARRKV